LLITANPSAATLAALYADPNFANLFGIPASAIAYVIDARNANLARNHLDGIDFDLGYHTASRRRLRDRCVGNLAVSPDAAIYRDIARGRSAWHDRQPSALSRPWSRIASAW
jgi:hypothetical protein